MFSRFKTLVLVAVVALCLHSVAHSQSANPILDLDTELQAGVWHGFALGPSYLDRAYVAEITPTSPNVSGAFIERQVVQPEFDGVNWNDVLRVMLASGYPSVDANIRVYELVDMPVTHDFDFMLQPAVWYGFTLGPCSLDRAYVPEFSPQAPHVDGATLERYIVQPEYFALNWIDVLRVILPSGYPPLDVNIRLYELADMPVSHDFDYQLQAGVRHGFVLGPSSLDRAYVAQINPLAAPPGLGSVTEYGVRPEFDGIGWNDVLRVYIPPGYPPLDVNIRVHKLPGTTEEITLLTEDVETLHAADVLNDGQSTSLTQKLDEVMEKLDRGNDTAAVNQLGAFINQVEDFVATGVLTPEEGQTLIDSANAIRSEILS